MLADVLQTALTDPGIRAHMHRLGMGHKSSCKPGLRGRYRNSGSQVLYSLRCTGRGIGRGTPSTAMP